MPEDQYFPYMRGQNNDNHLFTHQQQEQKDPKKKLLDFFRKHKVGVIIVVAIALITVAPWIGNSGGSDEPEPTNNTSEFAEKGGYDYSFEKYIYDGTTTPGEQAFVEQIRMRHGFSDMSMEELMWEGYYICERLGDMDELGATEYIFNGTSMDYYESKSYVMTANNALCPQY